MALVKLKIQSFESPEYAGSPLKTIYVLVNPENYSQDYTPVYKKSDVIGDPAQTMLFAGMGDDKLSLNKLVVDGTGVVPLEGADNVDDYIKQLGETVYKYQGNLHRPPYVKIIWGNLLFKGICTSFKVSYNLFKPDGTALRAFVDLEFKSSTDPQTKAQEANQQSPDLTHVRTVKAGDTLPLMTYRIYGDSAYYLEVARVNNLNNLSCLKAGDRIFFPPLKK